MRAWAGPVSAWNRAIFYDATTFHSGQIDAPELLDADPARGRLTINPFIRYQRRVQCLELTPEFSACG